MLKTYSVKFHLRTFGTAWVQITNARDVLHTVDVFKARMTALERLYMQDYHVYSIEEGGRPGDEWPVVDAEEYHA